MSAWKPLEINAFHIYTSNFIIILPGLLQVPFHGTGLEVMNYAAIGSILGHEITHGFDDLGRKYDKDGNLDNWWTRTTTAKFLEQIKCFVHQYEQYLEFEKKLRGKQYLEENIADNGGIRQSYMAYKKYKNRSGPESKLPGLEEYTDEQLFFISFAQIYCSNYTEEIAYELLSSEHSPDKYRVIGSLSNMEEFSEVWHCPKERPMNPEKKCVLW